MDLSRQYAESRDTQEPIGHFRAQFYIPDTGLVYSTATPWAGCRWPRRERLRDAIARE
nr:hypothetical protein GCM10020063_099130 [Dactylosporangium thailandense]